MNPLDRLASAGGGTWDLYRDERGIPVVRNEIHAAGRSELDSVLITAEVLRLMRKAVEGHLEPIEEVKSIRRKPTLYELRWKIGDQYVRSRLFRLYFVWFPNRGPERWGLRFAEKIKGSKGKEAQDRDIDLAWSRYKLWSERP